MSAAGQIAPADHVCYVHCNFCNTVLAVSVPGNSMLNVVTVRCGHCTNLLSVNLRGLMHPAPAPVLHDHLQENLSKVAHSINDDGAGFRDHNQSCSSQQQQHSSDQLGSSSSSSSSSRFRLPAVMFSPQINDLRHQQQTPHARPPEKRQRVPSAYNRFIKEEIRRIKANNPDISHREAFSTAAKNWAHFPNIHFGLNPGGGHECGNRLADVDTTTPVVTPAPKKIQGFCS